MQRNPHKCYEHRDKEHPDVVNLVSMLAKLRSYGGGDAYYRCPYCAYLKGFEDGRKENAT